MNEQKAIEYLKHMLEMMETEPPENLKSARDIKEWEDEHGKIRETLEISLNALEKQIPKEHHSRHLKLSESGFLCCSTTNKDIRYPLLSLRDLDYCPRCGRKLDWSELP